MHKASGSVSQRGTSVNLLCFLITSTRLTWCSAVQCCTVTGTELSSLKHEGTRAEESDMYQSLTSVKGSPRVGNTGIKTV